MDGTSWRLHRNALFFRLPWVCNFFSRDQETRHSESFPYTFVRAKSGPFTRFRHVRRPTNERIFGFFGRAPISAPQRTGERVKPEHGILVCFRVIGKPSYGVGPVVHIVLASPSRVQLTYNTRFTIERTANT